MSDTSRQTVQTVLVTGAARRLGVHVARRLAHAGKAVVLHAHGGFADAEAAATALRAEGCVACAVAGDLTDPDIAAALVGRAAETIGRPVDGLVNNASVFEPDLATDFTGALWERHFAIHVRAPCELARALHAGLPTGRSGAIVNVIDQRVFKLTPDFFSYTLSKSALATATRTLAQALAPRVRVNGVAPGPVLRNVRQTEADFARQLAATPLATGSPPDAVADAIAWLLDAPATTGQILAVDGGQSLIWQTPDVVGIVE